MKVVLGGHLSRNKVFHGFVKSLIYTLAGIVLTFFLLSIGMSFDIPDNVILSYGEAYEYEINKMPVFSIQSSEPGIVKIKNKGLASQTIKFAKKNENFQTDGTLKFQISLLGIFPFKDFEIKVVPQSELVACGNAVGVRLKMKGILIIGLSDVYDFEGNRNYPAKDSGFKKGDIITEIDNKKIDQVNQLIDIVENSKGRILEVVYETGGEEKKTKIKPIKAKEDQKFHLGIWVRDSITGIGTLTFYDPNSGRFGALGHGVTDATTEELMPVVSGDMMEATILTIRKGVKGVPGELKGLFSEEEINRMGNITKNSEVGIYGVLSIDKYKGRKMFVASRNAVGTGTATILCNVSGNIINEYEVEIEKISRNTNGNRGILLRVKDPRLLEITGGIVQGMSGSPILQNQKLIGAVTHVLVGDPTRGYGIFIDNMMQEISNW